MLATTCLYDQVLSLLHQYSQPHDLGHLKALTWMVKTLVSSGRLSCLPEWESYVPSRARQAQITEPGKMRSSPGVVSAGYLLHHVTSSFPNRDFRGHL
ncbi:hypothetical protein DO97_19010 [Neosynechococcus sphagnicola sy1]|uniref:Uncharacterized protein n=1 Tax=Neosynechococcus sphagnicola sy1 TaxID=1497020 RepID=A0A098TMN2_9CYAN|nr:hypothetical protein DO97_19010 [Neosynechococcus sphagnicola sy1]